MDSQYDFDSLGYGYPAYPQRVSDFVTWPVSRSVVEVVMTVVSRPVFDYFEM